MYLLVNPLQKAKQILKDTAFSAGLLIVVMDE